MAKKRATQSGLTMEERSRLRDERDEYIRRLYDGGKGLSMNQIKGKGYSKTTVFKAIHKVAKVG